MLYQPKFAVPPALCVEAGLQPAVAGFTNMQPDYVIVLAGEDGSRHLSIVDAKASSHVKAAHRTQVATYAWALNGLMKSRGSTTLVAQLGGVWRPGSAQPDVFWLAEPLRQLEGMLRKLSSTVLTRERHEAAAADTSGTLAVGQTWQLKSSCGSCEFLTQCRGEAAAKRPLTSLPNMSPEAAAALCALDADIEESLAVRDHLQSRVQGFAEHLEHLHYQRDLLQEKLSLYSPAAASPGAKSQSELVVLKGKIAALRMKLFSIPADVRQSDIADRTRALEVDMVRQHCFVK